VSTKKQKDSLVFRTNLSYENTFENSIGFTADKIQDQDDLMLKSFFPMFLYIQM